MNMHDALSALFYMLAFLAFAIGFWLISDGALRLETRRGLRHERSLDTSNQRDVDRESGRITGHYGPERP